MDHQFINVNEVSVVSLILGGFIVIFGLVSYFVKQRLYLSEALICLFVGVILGPYVLHVIEPYKWGNIDFITREFTRIVIAIQVMAAGVALPKAYLWKELKSLAILLVPVMIWMWVISAISIWLFIPNLSFLEALMIASCVTPTDPVLANCVVSGRFAEKHVPNHVRHVISAESAANDGFGLPFLFLAIYLLQMSPGAAIGKWFYYIIGYQILVSIIIGFLIGYIARKLLKLAEERKLIDKEIFMTFAIVLALFIMGAVSLIGSDDLLACFIAGNSFTWDDWFRVETAESYFQDVIDLLLNLAIFVYLGTVIPWSSFNEATLGLSYWRLIVVATLILLFRRLPIVMALLKVIPALKTRREGIFTGWFGPIGVAAIFYAQVAKENFSETDAVHAHARELIIPVTFFLVISSITIHGLSVPLIKIGRRVNTLTISRNQSLELRLTRSLRRGADAPDIYRINPNTIPETTSSETRNDLDKPKLIKECTPSIISSSIVQDEDITINVTDTNAKESDEQIIPFEIEDLSHKRFSIYEEEENIIIEDETEGKVYVINNPPLPPTTPTTTLPSTIQDADSNSQKSGFFSLFKKSSQEQND
ncbi:Sodium/hydrogen exchanger family-domain-containing protein [Glomus cerebriforme]|uniref:Sodium/hydrogen exchanger family-domain-containing protein n=1 Tax=Glomus cerebriforme TaxID=658196 RepID=A0A397TQJ8_9GLOM|nr:Sodium/hydrogen exchanger family-domain-containing protein [Glomus cerebriforme]